MAGVTDEPGNADDVAWQAVPQGTDLELPPGTSAVLLGESLDDFASAQDAPALAILSPTDTPAQLAAVAAVAAVRKLWFSSNST